MAAGTLHVFEEAVAYMVDGDWGSTDEIKIAICDDTVSPTVSDGTPALGDYTQVGTGGTYVSDGSSLGSLGAMVTEVAGVMTFDSGYNPTWAQDASNDVDAFWGVIYNDGVAGKPAIAFVELDGPVDMAAGDLTITWNVSGIYTITKS